MIGKHRGQVQIMHHRHHAAACRRIAARDLHHFELVGDITAGDRFVQQQPMRLPVLHRLPDLRQDARQMHALLLPARQFLKKAVGVMR